jgi:uncharacterized hydrophobic protein (TIGR00271 family)
MRQLYIEVPPHAAVEAERKAQQHDGLNVWRVQASSDRDGTSLLIAHLPNNEVGPYIQSLEEIDGVRITLLPRGVLAFAPPAEDAPDKVTDVSVRSPIEVFLAGLQSIGSFTGFVGYAVAAGVVVWIGLFTNTVYLLTASMLIAPFAGPAMNTAIGSATGNVKLLRRSLLRYGVGLGITASTAALLSLAMQQRIATQMMLDVSQVSIVSLLLPLVAGFAGALFLVQSERDSLVSGAAVGVLVAASLAPPTGLVGMAVVLGEWALVKSAAFVLVAQLVGINLSGAITFRLFGLEARGTRFMGGKKALFPIALAASAVMLVGLFVWQLSDPPELQRSSRAQRAAYEMRQAVEESGLGTPVEVSARFTRAEVQNQNTLLGVVYVQRADSVRMAPGAVADTLRRRIQDRILDQNFNVTPLVTVTVLDPPER